MITAREDGMEKFAIPLRVQNTLLNSLSAGVVPRVGLAHIAVGRKAEVESVLRDLDAVADGGAAFRLVVGRYGSGKSFFLQMIRDKALEMGFLVADADLSPERRLSGSKKEGLATYRELMANLSIKTRPEGGALDILLQRWILSLQQEVQKQATSQDDGLSGMENAILRAVSEMEGMVHAYDFSRVLLLYWRGCREGEDELRRNALRWFSGEFSDKAEAKQELGVSAIIGDDNWYDYIKLWARFAASIHYKGLLVFIDEAVNLYKISNSVARNRNYEKILTIFNDTMQGKAGYLGILLGGTPQFVEDERRGLYSYEALRSRLKPGRFAGEANVSGPSIRLNRLGNEEILLLLRKLRDLHGMNHQYTPQVSDEELVEFMQMAVDRMGADELLTPREVTRDFLELLDRMRQEPDPTFSELFQPMKANQNKQANAINGTEESAVHDEFDDFFSEF